MKRILLTLILSAGLLLSCAAVEEEQMGECLDWKTMVVKEKQRLPYPMQGVVVREKTIVYCREYDTTSV